MRRRTWIVIGVLVLIALPVAWYLISPLFIDKEVDEAFPTLTVEATETMAAAAAEPDEMMEEAMPAGDMASMSILADSGSVVICCVPFRVPFNAAPLSPP